MLIQSLPILPEVCGPDAGQLAELPRHLPRPASSDEVNDLRREATALKEVVADLTLEHRLLKKSVTAHCEGGE